MQPIERKSVGQAVYEQMREALVSGEWPKGSKIPSENELTKSLGVSRLSVREAIQRLSSIGLLESRRGEGTFVCEYPTSNFINTMLPMLDFDTENSVFMSEFRQIIEVGCVKLAVDRATEEDLALLETNNEKLLAMMEDYQDDDAYITRISEIDVEFHFLIAKATHNPIIVQVYEAMQPVWQREMKEIIAELKSYGARYYHVEILKALKARNKDKAVSIIDAHITNNINSMVNKRKAQEG